VKEEKTIFMKSVFIAGSRKFYDEIQMVVKTLTENKIIITTAGNWDKTKEDTTESEKKALLKAFEEIDNIDIVYILANEGHIGKTVAMEIAYGFAKNKEVISSSNITDLSAQALISKIIEPENLLSYCQKN